MAYLPLQGVRILAVEQYGAGPFGSMQLADMGAEVIKIENPAVGGDVSRATGPFFLGDGDSEFFQSFNRNKKSIALDLKSEQGVAVFHKLVAQCDAVMNNLRGDQPVKLGLDYASLKAVNPKIVCAHLSAYGRDNDRVDWPGYDYLMQAEAGFMALTGEPGTPPTRFGLSMVDFMTGTTTALALVSALLGVTRQGVGCDMDVSLFDVALQQLTYPATWYLNSNHETTRTPRSAHPATVPCQLYTTQDGWLFAMAMTPKFWTNMLLGIGREDLADDPRFVDANARRENRDLLTEVLDAEFAKQTTQYWLHAFKGKLPVAPVYTMAEALDNPYLQDIGMIQSVAHPHQVELKLVSSPIKINGQRLSAVACPPLGASTEAVLRDAGMTDGEIAAILKSED